jgi:hypothetical protein
MENETLDILEEKKKIPQFLNVLTILTFIGCAFAMWGVFDNAFNIDKKITDVEKQISLMEDKDMATGFGYDMLVKAADVLEQRKENVWLFFGSDLIGTLLCIFGALYMRKLVKNGFYLYTVGQILPIIISILILGLGSMAGFGAFTLVFPIGFIIMYYTQLKHMS